MKEYLVDEESIIRFPVIHRLLHLLVMMGFIGLALTGFSLKFSSYWWARGLASLVGGAGALASIHKTLAVLTYLCVVAHILWLMYYKLVLKGRLTGPGTMFPSVKDIRDMVAHIRYFLGRRGLPKFDRFTYMEKFDYLGLLIGMNTMGITGLVLWMPEFFTRYIPGYFVNIAQILHVYEALMAVALKFVVHVFTTHLRPENFPLDRTIFNGKISKERLRKEHAAQWERITQRVSTPNAEL